MASCPLHGGQAAKPAVVLLMNVLQNMLHVPHVLEVESLYYIKYCSNSKLQRGPGHV